MGLRRKVILFVATTVGLVQVLVGVTQLRDEAHRLRQESVYRGHQVQRALAVPCSVALANREIEDLDAILWRFSEADGWDLNIQSVAVLDLNGRVVAHTNPTLYGQRFNDDFFKRALASEVPLEKYLERSGTAYLQLSMPIVAGRRWGTMTMEVSMEHAQAQIAERRTEVWVGALLVTLLTALLLYLLMSRLVLQPLTLLSETAKRVAGGQLDARVPRRNGKDQIAVLTQVFNEMTSELQDYTSQLEAKVALRTQELEDVNLALERTNADLGDAVEKLGLLARTDGLTGLLNRRGFTESLDVEVRRTERHERPFSLLMIDVDYFKKFNDAFGHPAGDRLLISLGEILSENLRAMDVVARYGGEEFAVILGETSTEYATQVAEKLRQAVRTQVFREAGDGKPAGRVTISIGVATYPQDASSPSGLISQADQALYLAKEAGRDLVVACQSTAKETTE